MLTYIGMSFLVPVLLTLLLTPLVIRLAHRVGAVDLPNARKIHSRPMPRFGGVGICAGFILSLALFYFAAPDLPYFQPPLVYKHGMFVASLLLVLILGMWDDIRPLNPGQKFIVQVLAATLVYLVGFRISSITHPLETGILNIGFLDYPATVIWIVGVTNAVNLIDGLDGLASGVALIAFLTIGAISYMTGDQATTLTVMTIAGAVSGFLRYNFNPARIFLGDSGSLFLGFALAVLAMQSSTKGSTAFAILVPVLALGLPIMDTVLSMTRRLLKSLLPEERSPRPWLSRLHGMFLPDKKHIHHQLIGMGLHHRHAVLVMYTVSFVFGIGAFAVTIANNAGASLILIAVAIAMIMGVRQLRYREMAILRNGILLPLYEWPAINRAFLKGALDLVFIGVAFSLAYFLTFPEILTAPFEQTALLSLMIVCGAQLAVFYMSGVYQTAFRFMGLGDLLRLTRNVALSVLITGVVFAARPHPYPVTLFVLDFYFLLSLVVGARVSFYVLFYMFRRGARDEQADGHRILIYGADTRGLFTLQQLLHDDTLRLAPVGFIDDTPRLEGKRLDGLPIYGHWKLPRLLIQHRIDQILLAKEPTRPEVLRRLNQMAHRYGIMLTRSKIQLEDVPVRPSSEIAASA